MYLCHYKDKVYRAVNAANKALDEYKYHVVGGGAGTVSPSKFILQMLFAPGSDRWRNIHYRLLLSNYSSFLCTCNDVNERYIQWDGHFKVVTQVQPEVECMVRLPICYYFCRLCSMDVLYACILMY